MWWGHDVALEEDDKLDAAQARRVLRRSMKLMRPYRAAIVVATLVLIGYTVTSLAGPFILRFAIDHALPPRHHSVRVIEWAAGVYVGSAFLMAIFERAQIVLVNQVGESFLRDLRVRVFRHILSLSLSFFDTEQTGRLVARMTQDIDALELLVQQGLLVFVTSGLTFIVVLSVMLYLSPILFAVALFTLPWVIKASITFRRQSNEAYLTVRDKISQTLSTFQESVAGIRVVQAFGRERSVIRRFIKHNNEQLDANVHAIAVSARYFPILEFSGVAGTAAIVGVGGLMVHARMTSLGTVTAFILYLTFLIDPIQQISTLFNLVQQSGAALHKLYGLLDTPRAIAERKGAVDLPKRGDIELRGVDFAYRPGETDTVLHGVDLVVGAGERVALVGPTGAGKSTVAKLIARFYDPVAGSVSYGGVDLRHATVASLRDRIAVVPQEGFLFHGTILDNVRLGREGATDDEVRAALRLIGAEARFDAFAEGLSTEVRERGSRLSAGERQLVSLARAALANPDVLILDEATSNLDPGTESEVEAAMSALMEGRTVIVIAHRLSTAERADRVAVVDAGQVLEVGTHDELMTRGGRYAALYSSWAGSEGDSGAAGDGSSEIDLRASERDNPRLAAG
ncbi:MAG TPA: ABC transporter ATP-binding protein [Acidimicrobiales bacterium]|nr:ABC transporter ATP-binding protein [Acidimicrobiales bacterium]